MSDTAEKRIRELEDRVYSLEAIIRHVSEGVILTDRDCRITMFNPAKEKNGADEGDCSKILMQ